MRARITPDLLQRSVISVPPLCRKNDLSLSEDANRAQLDHMRAGGVTTFLWGGNANLYNMGVREFESFLDMVERLTQPGDWMIPSIGADFGKALDQADILRERDFPTAMVLPLRFPSTPKGVAQGLSLLAARMGKPLIAYVKDDNYVDAADLGALVRDGAVCAVKYGTVRKNPADDAALADILRHVDPLLVISGIGERPVIDHARAFGLRAFTSGAVCIAPRLSTMILQALSTGDLARGAAIRETFLATEDLRDAHSPLRVLHEAVRLAGIAETGPMQPMLSNITDPDVLTAIQAAAIALRAENDRAQISRAAE
ncbi:dihydrodipicolinate synthase family protein [Microvirga massiliensis]|uniref:dihydrodipicolinate synthase family protein n=1 Tax=Microvirga massiliensis TaxID=1033741 RepID=UPI00062BDFEB|nr:dihydrodipicolinate synthase family protein [Microvirga massiliensis]